jgi:uncharacterized lipoprotein YmbA
MQKISLLIVAWVFLAACTTTSQAPDTTYYLFDAEPVSQKQKVAKTRIMLRKVSVPDYLSTNQLVMRDSGHILIKANYHSWADSLDESIQRALISDLNNLNDDMEFVMACIDCVSVKVTIEHFYPSSDGKLLLSGSFEVSSSTGEYTISRFQLLDELEGDGYANAVKQMRKQVRLLALRINKSF